jgi:hypothetical protein
MRQRTVIQSAVLLALLVVILGSPSGMRAGTLNTGIGGQTLLHDASVVNLFTRQVGIIAPFYASLRVYLAGSDRLVTTITTDAEGRFRVELRPGFYRVVPDPMWRGRVLSADELVIGSYESAAPVKVQVRPHRVAPLTIIYEQMMGN